jgi:hypothetical protein
MTISPQKAIAQIIQDNKLIFTGSCRADVKLPPSCQLVGTAGLLEGSRGIQSLYGAFDILNVSSWKKAANIMKKLWLI